MLTDQSIRGTINRARSMGRYQVIRDIGKTRGLEFRAQPSGSGSFAVSYMPKGAGERRRLFLGTYSQHFGLADARREAATARLKIATGADPASEREAVRDTALAERRERKARKAAEAAELWMPTLIEKFAASRGTADRAAKVRRVLLKELAPIMGERPVASIRRADLQKMVDTIAARAAPTMAGQALEVARAMLRWAAKREHITGEPWAHVDVPETNGERTRVLTAAEIRWLWTRCEAWLAGDEFTLGKRNLARQLQLMLLLGARSAEIGELELCELSPDGRTWALPKVRAKNGREHVLPLPPRAQAIIAAAQVVTRSDRFLFLGRNGEPPQNTNSAHLLADAITEWNGGHAKADRIEPFRVHDLRRTCATGMEVIGISERAIEAVLNHSGGKRKPVTVSTCLHSDLSLAKLDALARWQAAVEDILDGFDPFSVRVEDRDAVIAKALARDHDGKPRLRVVG